MDKFDKLIKESVESYEAPYDAQAWANVSSQLGSKGGAMKWIVGSAAAVVLISGTIYLMQNDDATPATQAVTENTITGENTADNHALVADQTLNTTPGTSTETQTAGTENTPSQNVSDNGRPGNTHETGTNTPENGTSPTTPETNNGTNPGTNPSNTTPENSTQTGVNGSEGTSTACINAKFNTETTVACMNTEFLFTPEDINQAAVYVWDFGDGTFSSSKVAAHTYKRAGNFTASLSLKDPRTNKTLSKSSMDIVVNPLPEV